MSRKRRTVRTVTVIRDQDVPRHRAGRKPIGLYPQISRTKLAQVTGRHVSSITGILKGRTNCPADVAVRLAQALGMTVERLVGDLKKEQVRFARKKVEELQGRAGAARSAVGRTA